ncbi:MAG: hypothetical protein KDC39_14335 [Actinobacteria bacterium]|nr:hypothetical protein [Actinomycetota bacterium]
MHDRRVRVLLTAVMLAAAAVLMTITVGQDYQQVPPEPIANTQSNTRPAG